MSLSEKIYELSPITVQNLLISVYGYQLKKARYAGHFKQYLEALNKSQFHSKEQLHQLQQDQFRKLVGIALTSTPFYQDLICDKSIGIENITLENFTDIFPVITKDILRREQIRFVSDSKQPHKPVKIHTSGTSGTPLTISTTADSLQKNYAFFYRFLSWAGVNLGDRCATFAGRVLIPARQKKPPYWRYNVATNTILCSSYHIAEHTIEYYIRALEKFKPVYIDSYPSALYEIAKFINQTGKQHTIRLKCIITSSETLFDYQREALEKAFHCKVYDHLGSAEMATLITQCEHGSYHANPEYGLLEVLDNNDQPVSSGTSGRLICTSLINPTMPLIRYELGDSISLSEKSCLCGRHFPVIASITGRTDDLIIGCDGQKVGRLDPVFKKLDGSIKETQIIQTDYRNITIKMATEDHYDRKNTDNIINEIKNRVGDCMQFNIEYVDHIPRTSSGKFRSVISLVATDYHEKEQQ
jgi:phenylacetate-CoA ligase